MAGVVSLPNATYLANSASPVLKVKSNTSSASSTQQNGLRSRTCQVPYRQLQHNEAFGAPIEKPCYTVEKAKGRLIVSSTLAERIPEVKKPKSYVEVEVGSRWREIQGENRWKGLLGNPHFDPALRAELIRYGEFTQASYDSFDGDSHSPFCGSCKYGRKRFFEKMGVEDCGYEVTDYIYATAGKDLPPVVSKYFRFMVDEQGNKLQMNEAWDLETNWMGFVAVTKDEDEIKRLGRRDIVVVFRGTQMALEWLEDLEYFSKPTGADPRRTKDVTGKSVDLMIESGFLEIYKANNQKSRYTRKSARQQVLEAITRLVKKYGDHEELSITLCGHSLGSALAMLAGYDIAETGVNQVSKLPDRYAPWDKPDAEKLKHPDQVVEWTRSKDVKTVPVTVFSFGGPRVGNDAFRDRVEELDVKVLRVVNCHDLIPDLPGLIFNERLHFLKVFRMLYEWQESLPWTYSQVGVKLTIDNLISPYLKKTTDPNLAHNLEAYLHVLSGFHGPEKPFEPVITRDFALVNKAGDFIDKQHYVPPSWWQDANKGLVKTPDRRWIRRPRDKADMPQYDLDDQPHH